MGDFVEICTIDLFSDTWVTFGRVKKIKASGVSEMAQNNGANVRLGINGLDQILFGGVSEESVVLVQGAPGSGKTTFGAQFLYKGITEFGDPGIYITFEEMPEQIYRDMSRFGWELQTLEADGKLRVVCLNPQTLIDDIENQDGIFERLVRDIGCKRVVIDSISLVRALAVSELGQRSLMYKVISTLRRLHVTSLLLLEYSDEADKVSWEHFLVDGIITLSSRVFYEHYRKRTIEITKMRGRKSVKGQHIFRICDTGITVVPPLDILKNVNESNVTAIISSGVDDLDTMIGGGFGQGSMWVLESDMKARHFCHPDGIAEALIYITPTLETIERFEQRFKYRNHLVKTLVAERRLHIIECGPRYLPTELEQIALQISCDNGDFRQQFLDAFTSIVRQSAVNQQTCIIFLDIDPIVSNYDEYFVWNVLPSLLESVRQYKAMMIVSSYLEATPSNVKQRLFEWSTGVLSTWVDGRYQIFQVKKSPNGFVSEPFVVLSAEDGVQLI